MNPEVCIVEACEPEDSFWCAHKLSERVFSIRENVFMIINMLQIFSPLYSVPC